MNERIAKIYDQALILESNGDYVAGELDPVKKEVDYMRALRAEGMSVLQTAKLTKRSSYTVKKYTAPEEPVSWHCHYFGVE